MAIKHIKYHFPNTAVLKVLLQYHTAYHSALWGTMRCNTGGMITGNVTLALYGMNDQHEAISCNLHSHSPYIWPAAAHNAAH